MQTDLKRIQSIITSINSSTENNVSNKASVQDQSNQRFNELKAELLSMYEELNVSRPTQTDQSASTDTNNNNDDDVSIKNDDDNNKRFALSELLDIILDFINKLLKKAPEDSDDDENPSSECNAGENDNDNDNKCDKVNAPHNGDNIQINVINTPEGDRADENEDEESDDEKTDAAKNKSDKQIDVLVKEYVQSMHRQFAIRKELKDGVQTASRNGLFYAEIKNDINIHESNRKVQNKLLEEQSKQSEIMNTIAYLIKLNKERNESNKTNQDQNSQPV